MNRELYQIRSRSFSVKILQTKIASVKEKDVLRTAVRVYDKGLIGIKGVLGHYDEEDLAKKAAATLKYRNPYPFKPTAGVKKHILIDEFKMSTEEFMEENEAFLKELRNSIKGFSFSHKISILESRTVLKNDLGLDLINEDRTFALSLIFKEKSSVNIIDGGFGYAARKWDRNDALPLLDGLCGAYAKKAALPKEERIPVVFIEHYEGMDALFKLVESLGGMSYGSGTSLLSGKESRKVFNEKFSFYQSTDPVKAYTEFFDAEGIFNKGFLYPLIEKGVFKTPYTDKFTADLYKLPLTGASVSHYDGKPTLALPGIEIGRTHRTIKDILGGRKAVYVMMSAGGDFTPQGDMSLPVQLSFLYDGEKLIGRLPQLQISGNIFDMFGGDFMGAAEEGVLPYAMLDNMVLSLKVSGI